MSAVDRGDRHKYIGGFAIEDAPPVSKEIYDVLKLVVAEWDSDPMSVQCFDLRIVDRAKKACAQFEQCYPTRESPDARVLRGSRRHLR